MDYILPTGCYIHTDDDKYYRPRGITLLENDEIQFETQNGTITASRDCICNPLTFFSKHCFGDFFTVCVDGMSWYSNQDWFNEDVEDINLVINIPEKMLQNSDVMYRLKYNDFAVYATKEGEIGAFIMDEPVGVTRLENLEDIELEIGQDYNTFTYQGQRYGILEGMTAHHVNGVMIGCDSRGAIKLYPESADTAAILRINYDCGREFDGNMYYFVNFNGAKTFIRTPASSMSDMVPRDHQVLRAVQVPAGMRYESGIFVFNSQKYRANSFRTESVLFPDQNVIACVGENRLFSLHNSLDPEMCTDVVPDGCYFELEHVHIFSCGIQLSFMGEGDHPIHLFVSIDDVTTNLTRPDEHLIATLQTSSTQIVKFHIEQIYGEPVVFMNGAQCTLPIEFCEDSNNWVINEVSPGRFMFNKYGPYTPESHFVKSHHNEMFVKYKLFALFPSADGTFVKFNPYYPPQKHTKVALPSQDYGEDDA